MAGTIYTTIPGASWDGVAGEGGTPLPGAPFNFDRGPAGGGVPSTQQYLPASQPSRCPDWAWRFFQNADLYVDVAKRAGTDVDFVMALSAFESHWNDVHAQELHNLFGVTDAGGPNLNFSSYQASANDWVRRYGTLVSGTETISAFLTKLLGAGYNTINSGYTRAIIGWNDKSGKHHTGVLESIKKRAGDCNVKVH